VLPPPPPGRDMLTDRRLLRFCAARVSGSPAEEVYDSKIPPERQMEIFQAKDSTLKTVTKDYITARIKPVPAPTPFLFPLLRRPPPPPCPPRTRSAASRPRPTVPPAPRRLRPPPTLAPSAEYIALNRLQPTRPIQRQCAPTVPDWCGPPEAPAAVPGRLARALAGHVARRESIRAAPTPDRRRGDDSHCVRAGGHGWQLPDLHRQRRSQVHGARHGDQQRLQEL
jgi:hypothetical protein